MVEGKCSGCYVNRSVTVGEIAKTEHLNLHVELDMSKLSGKWLSRLMNVDKKLELSMTIWGSLT